MPSNLKKKLDLVLAVALGSASLVYLWSFRATLPTFDPDEGIVLQGAERVLAGQVPYRDFFTFYTPGSYYWFAFLLKIFGNTILVPRTVLVLYGALFSVLTFLMARALGASRLSAAIASVLLLVCCMPVRFLVIHNWDATVAALLSLYLGIAYVRAPSLKCAFFSGFFVAVSILFNQARGVGLLLGIGLGFIALHWRGEKPVTWARLAAWLSGIAFPLAATVIYFASQGSLRIMLSDLFWPHLHYSSVNRLPYGYISMNYSNWDSLFQSASLAPRALHWLIVSPILLICAAPIAIVLVASHCRFTRREMPLQESSAVVLCGAVTLGTLATLIATRPDFTHVTFLLPLCFFVWPWVFDRWLQPYPTLTKLKPLVLVYVIVAFSAYGLALRWPTQNAYQKIQTRQGIVRTLEPNQAIPYIQEHAPAGSELLVYPYLPLYYFLTRSHSPLRYDYLQPGMNTEQQFREAIAEMESRQPQIVLFENQFVSKVPGGWPNTPLSAIANDPLADYIVSHYRYCRTLDRQFLYMVRRDLVCP